MPSPLIAMLKARKLSLTNIARMIHPSRREPSFTDATVRGYLPLLSRHLSGKKPITRSDDTLNLNPTWQSLKAVLTGDEFTAALEYAKECRKTAQKI